MASKRKKRPGAVNRLEESHNGGERDTRDRSDGARIPKSSFCPYCGGATAKGARKCSHCHEFIDPRFSNVDEGTFRFARLVVLEDIKSEIRRWFRQVLVGGSFVGLVLFGLGVFGFRDFVGGQVRHAIDREIGEQVRVVESDVDALQDATKYAKEDVAKLQAIEREREREARGLRSEVETANATSKELNLIQLVRLREQLERRLDRTSGSGGSVSTPPIVLRSPAALLGERPAVIYGSDESRIRFEWKSREPVGDGVMAGYELSISSSPDFAPASTVRFETRFPIEFVEMGDLPNGKDGQGPFGTFYWTARSRSADENEISAVGVFERYSSAIQRVKKKKEIRIGITALEAEPFAYFDAEAGRMTGLDVELGRRIADLLPEALPVDVAHPGERPESVEPVFLMYDWLPLLVAPSNNDVDFIISAITITEQRETFYDIAFTESYFPTAQCLIVPETMMLHGLDDLKNLRWVAQRGTTGWEAAKQHVKADQIVSVEAVNDLYSVLFQDTQKNRTVAILDHEIARTHEQDGWKIVHLDQLGASPGKHPEFFDDYGIAVARPQSALLESINGCLRLLRVNGDLDGLREEFDLR